MSNKTYSVVGTDGVVPVHEPDGVWKTWNKREIYEGKEGRGKYVPKVGDYVTEAILFGVNAIERKYLVKAIDPLTLVPELIPFVDEKDDDHYHPSDPYLRVGRLNIADTYRVYLDTSVSPYTMSIDGRYSVKGSEAHHFVLYKTDPKSRDPDNSLKAVSMVFDQRNQLITTSIDLESVSTDSLHPHVVKRPLPFHSREQFPDGETLIGVVYNDAGGIVQKKAFIVENTGVIRQRDPASKYITDITLESPFLSEADPSMVMYPLGYTVNSLNMFGRVHYSDGTSKRMAIDNSKFSILGLTDYIASIIGHNTAITLRYTLDNDEAAVGLNSGLNLNSLGTKQRFITRSYNMKTVKPDNQYAVKLYVYPEWLPSISGYHLRWFLFDLTRSGYKEVTEHVRLNESQSLFKPNAYGIPQRLSATVNLKDVNPLHKEFYHTQVVDVNLMRPASDRTGYHWSIGYEITDTEYFGVDNWARMHIKEADFIEFDISLDCRDMRTWLERIWGRTKPLYDHYAEGGAPEPNMFKIVVDGTVRNKEYLFNINQWNQKLFVEGVFEPTDNVYIVFIKQTADSDMYLGMAALPIFVV